MLVRVVMFCGTIFLVFIIFCIFHKTQGDGCVLSLNQDLLDPQELLLTTNGGYGNDAFCGPTNSSGLYFQIGDTIELNCPGGSILVNGASLGTFSQFAQCVNGKQFLLGATLVNVSQISCSKQPEKAAVYTGKTCLGAYKEIKIGFTLDDGRFLTIMYICFDDVKQNTLYSVFNLTSKIDAYQANYPRPGFLQSTFYNLGSNSLDTLYTRNKQREVINQLLGLNSTSYKYIEKTNDYYLARGHLSAKTDYLYGSQQRLTFYFVNVAPQWQTLNSGNGLSLENSIRSFAAVRNLDLVVYTGTYGILTLPHEQTGKDVELYLYVGTNGQYGIPVPELFWKAVYDPVNKAGVVFLTINNPYKNAYVPICNNICNQINWINWNPDNIKSGFAYCCTINDFRSVVSTLPIFTVNQVLV